MSGVRHDGGRPVGRDRMVGVGDALQDRCMSDEDPESAGGLPALLAEYGRVAAGLGAACPEQAQRLHERLAELDVAIDGYVAELGVPRL